MPNKRGGWKNVQELIKGEVLIRMSRVEKVSKINKQDTPYIRQVRVVMDYSISSGLITRKGFFQVRNHREYKNLVIISFVHLEKINIFCFMPKGVAQKLSLPRPLEN